MAADILRTVWHLSKLGKLGSYATLCFGCCKKKGYGRVPIDLTITEYVIFNANQNARGRGVFFNISGRSCGSVWKVAWLFGAISKILSVRIKRKLVRALTVWYTLHFLWNFLVYNFFNLSINRTKESTNTKSRDWKSLLEFVLISSIIKKHYKMILEQN